MGQTFAPYSSVVLRSSVNRGPDSYLHFTCSSDKMLAIFSPISTGIYQTITSIQMFTFSP